MVKATSIEQWSPRVVEALSRVQDPEIPVISVLDMGMIVYATENGSSIEVGMTPTFVGCPAIDMIRNNIRTELLASGFEQVTVNLDQSVVWNSNRISPKGKQALEDFGLAPPPDTGDEEWSPEMLDRVRCPHCKSTDTTLRSAFGSTLCRAIRFCFNCKQGFEQFKPV